MTNKPNPPRRWMRPCKMAATLNTSLQNINNMVNRGKLERKRDERGVLVRRAEV